MDGGEVLELGRVALVAAYALTGVVAAVGYVPTIRDLLARKPSACSSSYRVWTATSAVSVLYAAAIAQDPSSPR